MERAAMASLSSVPCYTREALWGAERNSCICASAQAVASSTRVTRRERELRISSFAQIKVLTAERSKLRLLQVAARRSSQKEKSIVEEPLDDGEDDDEDYVLPELPGEEPDFWEGPQFELLGFIVQYLWAIGVGVALIGCFFAVRYYNYGAADFKETEVFKDAMESQGFQESPLDSKVFEEPPPQDAPPVTQESMS